MRESYPAKKCHRGVYTLVIFFRHLRTIRIRKHVSIVLEPGLYLYTGSALGYGSTSLEARIRRHCVRQKTKFWHIDRILACRTSQIVAVLFAETSRKAECGLNKALLECRNFSIVAKGIGSSDCRCNSHFLAAKGTLRSVQQTARSCYAKMGLRPCILEIAGPGRLGDVNIASERIRTQLSMFRP